MDIVIIIAALIGLAITVFSIWVFVRIIHKAGYSGWWVILVCIPFVVIIMIWIFAFADWPALRRN